jgi:hypothetical protein
VLRHAHGTHSYIWPDLTSYIPWLPDAICPFFWPLTCHVQHISFQPILFISFYLRQNIVLSRATQLSWTGAHVNSALECLSYCTISCSLKTKFRLGPIGVPSHVYRKGTVHGRAWKVVLFVNDFTCLPCLTVCMDCNVLVKFLWDLQLGDCHVRLYVYVCHVVKSAKGTIRVAIWLPLAAHHSLIICVMNIRPYSASLWPRTAFCLHCVYIAGILFKCYQ